MLNNPHKRVLLASFNSLLLLCCVFSTNVFSSEGDDLSADFHWRDNDVRFFILKKLITLINEKYEKESDLAFRAMLMSLDILEKIKDPELQARGFLFIGAETPFKQYRAPLLNRAVESSMQMFNTHNRDFILEHVVAEQAITDFDAALKTIDKMQDNLYGKPLGLTRIARETKDPKKQIQALELAVKVSEPFETSDKIDAYILISDFYYRLEFPNRAEKILDRALELANTIKDTKKRTFMIDQINKAQ